MPFTDGVARFAAKKDCEIMWYGDVGNFRCCFCGYSFELGDMWRWQYSNNTNTYGNPITCALCDDKPERLIEKWRIMHKEAKTKYWWFTKNKVR